MTRKFIESAYHILKENMTSDSMLSVVILNEDGKLVIGLQSVYADANLNSVTTNCCTVTWNTENQLTMKQLLKISKIWNELILQSE